MYAIVDMGGATYNRWSYALLHEVAEVLVDPGDDTYNVWPDGTRQLLEVCDPVEDDTYTLDGVSADDFALPAAWSGGDGPYDQAGDLAAPLAPGSTLALKSEPAIRAWSARRGGRDRAAGSWIMGEVTLGLMILAAVAVSLWTAHRTHASSRPAELPFRDHDLDDLRARYLAGSLTLEEFEAGVTDVLEGRPVESERYEARWEIHVHDAPPGHSLHIHLP